MREAYFNTIIKNELPEIFKDISELSYSKKYKIILDLLERYNRNIVSDSLYEYYNKYIVKDRIDLNKLKNQLIYFCELFQRGMRV